MGRRRRAGRSIAARRHRRRAPAPAPPATLAPARTSAGNGGIRRSRAAIPPEASADCIDRRLARDLRDREEEHELVRTNRTTCPQALSRPVALARFPKALAVADDDVVRRPDHQSRVAADGGAAAARDAAADGGPRRARDASIRAGVAARRRSARPRPQAPGRHRFRPVARHRAVDDPAVRVARRAVDRRPLRRRLLLWRAERHRRCGLPGADRPDGGTHPAGGGERQDHARRDVLGAGGPRHRGPADPGADRAVSRSRWTRWDSSRRR